MVVLPRRVLQHEPPPARRQKPLHFAQLPPPFRRFPVSSFLPLVVSSFRRLVAPLLLLAYAAAVVLLTWPWLAHPATQVFDHWDPPFHAWKLAFAARTLLSVHVLPAYGNTNLYYPHSGAFFYEALHWPQAVFAAPLLAPGYAQNGSVIYTYASPLRAAVDRTSFPFAADRLVPADVPLPVLSHFPSGAAYTLSFDLLTASSRRLTHRLPDGKKSHHLLLPLTVTLP